MPRTDMTVTEREDELRQIHSRMAKVVERLEGTALVNLEHTELLHLTSAMGYALEGSWGHDEKEDDMKPGALNAKHVMEVCRERERTRQDDILPPDWRMEDWVTAFTAILGRMAAGSGMLTNLMAAGNTDLARHVELAGLFRGGAVALVGAGFDCLEAIDKPEEQSGGSNGNAAAGN